jgi:hypothetical protein
MVKRRRKHRDVRKYAHPKAKMKKELTVRQLAAIGAVALAYNELDMAVDALLCAFFGAPRSIGGSIANSEAKIATINKAVVDFRLEEHDRKQIAEALNSFWKFTLYHSAITHLRIIKLIGDESISPQISQASKLANPFTDNALNIFYDHVIALEKELSSAAMLIQATSTLRSLPLDDPKTALYEEGERFCRFQFRGYGTRRQTLPPIPYLPSETDLSEVKDRWQKVQNEEMMAWLSAWPGPEAEVE